MTQAKPLCGFLNVLKPPGMSSAQVVGCVRRLLGGVKAATPARWTRRQRAYCR